MLPRTSLVKKVRPNEGLRILTSNETSEGVFTRSRKRSQQ